MRYWMIGLSAAAVLLLFVNCQSEGNSAGKPRTGQGVVTGRDVVRGGEVAAGKVSTVVFKGGEEEVRFTTADGVVITGTLYAAGDRAPAVLCLHQWRSDRGSFAALAKTLQGAGMTVLAIDLRGYGGSTRTARGGSVRPDRRAVEDVKAAMAFLRAHPKADPSRIGIVGASYGSSNALIYAADDPGVRALVLISPGLNYFNELPTEQPLRRFGDRPLLVTASSEDLRSVETVEAYRRIAPSMQVQEYANAGHGTDILEAGVGLDTRIREFMKKNL